jgi:hypothetical protein
MVYETRFINNNLVTELLLNRPRIVAPAATC